MNYRHFVPSTAQIIALHVCHDTIWFHYLSYSTAKMLGWQRQFFT